MNAPVITPFFLRNRLRGCDRAVLATLAHDDGRGITGYPAGALTLASFDHAGRPLLLLSALAHHRKNLERDPRASLHLELDAPPREPLSGARLVLFGRAERVDDDALLARILRRHPEAERYAALDFHPFRLAVERVHVNGGYGAARWWRGAEFLAAEVDGLAALEADALAHMNADHADALAAIARHAGLPDGDWRMTGLDPDGFDLCNQQAGLARIAYAEAMSATAQLRPRLVALAQAARGA